MSTTVQGHCPMGCGTTLFLGSGGYVTCRNLACPRPEAVSDLIDDRETEHQVTFDVDGFTIRHPLRERLAEPLLDCDLHRFCADMTGPPAQLGTYRVTRGRNLPMWSSWTLLPPAEEPA